MEPVTTENGHTKIGVRESTKRKLAAVKEARDWSYATTVDKAADALLEREGVTVDPAPVGKVADSASPSPS